MLVTLPVRQSPVLTFGLSAREWKDRHLVVNKETFVSTQHVLRVEQAHPSTFGRHPFGGNHISGRSGSNSDVAAGTPLSQVDQESLRHCARNLQLPVGRNGAEWQASSVAVARKMEEGRATKERAARAAALHGFADGGHREQSENSDVSLTFRSG